MSSYMRAKDSQVVLFFRALRNGVFGTLTVLQKKKTPQRPFLVYLFSLIQFSQMLHFILAFPAGFIWPGGTIAQAASIVSFASPSSYFYFHLGGHVCYPVLLVGIFFQPQ